LVPIRKTAFLRESSKLRYLDQLKNSKEITGMTIADIMRRPNVYAGIIEKKRASENYSTHWKDGMISAILSVWRYNHAFREENHALFREWKDLKANVSKPIQEMYRDNIPSQRQKDANMTFSELCKKRDELDTGSPERLLLLLYTVIPPARSDYDRCRVHFSAKLPDRSQTDNHIVLFPKSGGKLLLDNYKTSDRYRRIEQDLPEVLDKELRQSLSKNPRDYLFEKNGVPMKAGTWNRWANNILKKVTGKDKMCLTMLRHIYISRKDLDIGRMTAKEKDSLARLMGHSRLMQEGYHLNS